MVGGAVRDTLLGRPVHDRDWVVVGATPEQMVALGYLPVGRDFPVFLHPKTREEYALARTERKTAPGYKGFEFHAAPDVTLEEDLVRRDLTINAIAMAEDGRLIDPFGGQNDLRSRVLRHVSLAFEEDPVRILRVARFAARFTDFSIAAETMALMKKMVESGEVDALVPERVWQEISRGLMEGKPSRMFLVLRESGALNRILPELNALWGVPQPVRFHSEIDAGVHTMLVVDYAARKGFPLPIRVAALLHDLGKGATPPCQWPHHHAHEARSAQMVESVCRRLKVPNAIRELAVMAAREHGNIRRGKEMRANTVVSLLERCDAFRKPQRFLDMISVAESDMRGRGAEDAVSEDEPFEQRDFWQTVLKAARGVDAGEIAQACRTGKDGIPDAIHKARVEAVTAAVNADPRLSAVQAG